MRRAQLPLAPAALGALAALAVLAGCGNDDDDGNEGPAAPPAGGMMAIAERQPGAGQDRRGAGEQPAAPAARRPRPKLRLKLLDSPYGRVLFVDGYAAYAFTADGKRSKCYGACAEAWPPLRAPLRARVIAGKGVERELIGRVKRRDGSRQLTYAGQPIYGYIDDPRGEVLCHDVVEFGGTWLALLGNGEPAP